jgi:hypothetical protein
VVKQAAWDAVIFDYGGVLCYAPARQDVAQCAECSGLDEETFYKLYTGTRQYYGLAAAGYRAHWHRVAKAAGITSEAAVKRFIDRESHLWTRANPETLALARECLAKVGTVSGMRRLAAMRPAGDSAAGTKRLAPLAGQTGRRGCATEQSGNSSRLWSPSLYAYAHSKLASKVAL